MSGELIRTGTPQASLRHPSAQGFSARFADVGDVGWQLDLCMDIFAPCGLRESVGYIELEVFQQVRVGIVRDHNL